MNLVGGCVPSFQKVVVWPFDIIIHEEVSHQALKLIDREESTRAVKEVIRDLRKWREHPDTHHACFP